MKTLHEFSKVVGAITLAAATMQPTAAGLSAGGYHVVRVDAGLVKGLGDGTYGQLGTNPAGSPATVAGLSGVTNVAAGGFSTLALKSDGSAWFLGESTLQHTTPHGTPNPVSTPVQVAELGGIDAIAAGHRHFLALDADSGELFAWGHNGSGQVGNGSLLDVTTPVLVLTGVASMAAGDGFSLAVKSDHTLWAWGRNTHGQLGLGDTADRLSPTQVPGVTTAASVAAGGQHALILLTGGSVLATGDNDFGQLGLGTTISTATPTPVPGLSGITALAAGYSHSAAIGPGSQVSVWGRNFEGQCGGGNSSPVTYTSPQVLAGLSGTPTGIDCGYHFTLIELADGSIAATGSNSDGQLDGNSVADQDNSQKILTPQLTPLSPDLTAPSPDPMSFASPPSAVDATSVTMTAATATDPSGPVEYYFENVTNSDFRDWSTTATWTNTGLSTNVAYAYRVKARDAVGNETAFSDPASAIPAGDTSPPQIAALSPVNGAGNVPVNALLGLTLNENVRQGVGSLSIKRNLDNAVVANIDITAGAVTVSGAEVTIDPPVDLANGTQYYVEVTNGAITDLAGNSFAGIAGSKTWSFVTAAVTAPGPILVANHSFEADENTDATGAFASGECRDFAGGELTGWIRQTGTDTQTSVGWKDIIASELDPSPAVVGRESQALSLQSGAGVLNTTGTAWSSLRAGDMLTLTISLGMRSATAGINWNENTFFGLTDGVANLTTIEPGDTIANSGLIGNNPATGTQAGDGTFTDVSFTHTVLAGDLTRSGNLGILIYSQGAGATGAANQSFFDNVRLNRETASAVDFGNYISNPAFGLDPGEQGFALDPDGDHLANGLEAWFGTHPGEFNAGLTILTTDGMTTTFKHPQNENAASDLIGFYQWSPNLIAWYAGDGVDGPLDGPTVTISLGTTGSTTTVTATASEPQPRIFLRAGVMQP